MSLVRICSPALAATLSGSVLLAASVAAAQDQSATPAPAAEPAGASDTAGQSTSDLAKKIQNPIGDLISVPFQSNTNFNVGPHNGTQELLNIQPVVPFHINPDWNIIVRGILPLVWSPSFEPAPSTPFGTGPTTLSAFLAPAQFKNGWLWGVGPVVQAPTASSPLLGSSVWGLGPTGVLVYMNGPWVVGGLVNNVWSLGGHTAANGSTTRYNTFTGQPFVNYNMKGGWYVGTSPLITANWLASSGNQWTLPLGGNVGRVIRVGKQPVNLSVGVYGNVVRPQFAPSWQLRNQVTLIF